MRAAGIVLGALGLFGSRSGALNEADLLVGQTLAHIACVAILQEHAPTPSTVMPQLRSALASRVVVEQAKGFLRGTLDVSVEEAFALLRTYSRASGEHLTDVARRLMTDKYSRPALLAALTELAPQTLSPHRCRARARRAASSTSRSATTWSLVFSFWLIRVSRSNAACASSPERLRMIPIA